MSSSIGKLSRAEFRRQKDLDADRKAGRAPAEIDDDGNIINPHVPAYMANAPWYLDTGKRSLKHQKKPVDPNQVKATIDDWYDRGKVASSVATKYRKGACENCGAITHKRNDCLERPRKKGAKLTGKDIAPDEAVTDIKGLEWDAKRDRWNGYDPSDHKKVMQEFEAIEEERRRLKEEQIDNQTSNDLHLAKKLAKKEKKPKDQDDGFSSSEDDYDDDEKYAEKADQVGQKVDTNKRITIRNLRIREDRAKYLYNLDPNSAYYDPKTRSMREAPNANIRPEDAEYAGDNFVRSQGQVNKMQQLQLFAWQAEARGNDTHMQANPTANERQFREFQEKKEKLIDTTKSSILEKYGGAEHFDSLPKELLAGQTESYVEYNQSGQVVKGLERAKAKSKYLEDVLESNHTTVWGSWYDLITAQWGYKCCHSNMPNSYCTGQAGIEASKASILPISKTSNQDTVTPVQSGKRRKRSVSVSSASSSSFSSSSSTSSSSSHRSRRKQSRRSPGSDSDSETKSKSTSKVKSYQSTKNFGQGDVSSRLDKQKLKQALEEERAKRDPTLAAKLEERKRKRQENKPEWLKEVEQINARGKTKQKDDYEVTEEQLEAYKLANRDAYEDPMVNYRDEKEVNE